MAAMAIAAISRAHAFAVHHMTLALQPARHLTAPEERVRLMGFVDHSRQRQSLLADGFATAPGAPGPAAQSHETSARKRGGVLHL